MLHKQPDRSGSLVCKLLKSLKNYTIRPLRISTDVLECNAFNIIQTGTRGERVLQKGGDFVVPNVSAPLELIHPPFHASWNVSDF